MIKAPVSHVEGDRETPAGGSKGSSQPVKGCLQEGGQQRLPWAGGQEQPGPRRVFVNLQLPGLPLTSACTRLWQPFVCTEHQPDTNLFAAAAAAAAGDRERCSKQELLLPRGHPGG